MDILRPKERPARDLAHCINMAHNSVIFHPILRRPRHIRRTLTIMVEVLFALIF